MVLGWKNELLTAAGSLGMALCLLVLPLRWLIAWLTAVAIHEAWHLAAVWICRGNVGLLRLDAAGAKMAAYNLTLHQQLFCLLAGPIGTLLTVLPLAKRIPGTAVCALIQSAYNLLPMQWLDGGRAIRCAMELFFGDEVGMIISHILHKLCAAGILIGSLYCSIRLKLGVMPIVFALWMVIRGNFGKRPCKGAAQAVQ